MTPERTSSPNTGASSLRRLRAATLLLFTSFVLLVLGSGVYYLEQQRQANRARHASRLQEVAPADVETHAATLARRSAGITSSANC